MNHLKKCMAVLLSCILTASLFTFAAHAQDDQSILVSFSSSVAVTQQSFSCQVSFFSTDLKSGEATIRYNPDVLEYQSVAAPVAEKFLQISVLPTLVKEGELLISFTCAEKTEKTGDRSFFDVVFKVKNSGALRLDLRAENFTLHDGTTVSTNDIAENVATWAYPQDYSEIGYQRHKEFLSSDWGLILPKPMSLSALQTEYGVVFTGYELQNNTVHRDSAASYKVKLELDGTIVDSVRFALIGDGDNDGVITAADARSALRESAGIDPYLSYKHDVDFDGTITAADARSILRCSVGLDNYEDWHSALVKARYNKYPAKQIYALPSGDNVPFTENTLEGFFPFKNCGLYIPSEFQNKVNHSVNVGDEPFIFCAESKSELHSLYQLYEKENPDIMQALAGYDDEFFKTKALIIVNGTLMSGHWGISFDAMKKTDNTLQFCITKTYFQGGASAVHKPYGLITEIDKSILEGVETFEYYLQTTEYR